MNSDEDLILSTISALKKQIRQIRNSRKNNKQQSTNVSHYQKYRETYMKYYTTHKDKIKRRYQEQRAKRLPANLVSFSPSSPSSPSPPPSTDFPSLLESQGLTNSSDSVLDITTKACDST